MSIKGIGRPSRKQIAYAHKQAKLQRQAEGLPEPVEVIDKPYRAQGKPIPDSVRATIHVLASEGKPYSEIVRKIDCSKSTVGEVLREDPENYQDKIAQQTAERAELWSQAALTRLDLAQKVTEMIEKAVLENDVERLKDLKRAGIDAKGLIADANTAQSNQQLLTGKPTERVESDHKISAMSPSERAERIRVLAGRIDSVKRIVGDK